MSVSNAFTSVYDSSQMIVLPRLRIAFSLVSSVLINTSLIHGLLFSDKHIPNSFNYSVTVQRIGGMKQKECHSYKITVRFYSI